ncbi:MAG: signal peptidase II [Acidobacteriota bacterium]
MRFLSQRSCYLTVTLGVILADRSSKAAVQAHLDPYRPLSLIPGFFDFTYVENPGGVFGLFRDLSAGVRGVLFTLIPVAAILLIALYARRVPPTHRLTQTSLALILGGALGNLVDRLRLGYVVDFLDFHWRGYHWPAFNLADSAICTGVAMLMLESFLTRESVRRADSETDSP